MKEAIKRRIVRLFSAAVVGGQAHASYLEALGQPADRIFRGYDVVDNEYFAHAVRVIRDQFLETRAKQGLPENYFLASARFIPKKN